MFKLLISFILTFCINTKDDYKVTSLPDYKGSRTDLGFSGYMEWAPGKNTFFWYFESAQAPSTDPLVLWFTGGPGCSGLDALLQENGPFKFDTDGKLADRKESWNNVANMLFFEQPLNVGYSYSTDPADLNQDDPTATENTYHFLSAFLEQFSELQGRDIWLTGESYGGTYIPWFSQRLLNSPLKSVFKGAMLGNPVMWCPNGGLQSTLYQYYEINNYYYHGLIPFHVMHEYNLQCQADPSTKACTDQFDAATKLVGVIYQQLKYTQSKNKIAKQDNLQLVRDTDIQADLSPDDLYHDFCTGDASLEPNLATNPGDCHPLSAVQQTYLNRADVQQALHAARADIPKWEVCNSTNLNYTISYKSIPVILKDLFEANLHILYYSGDVDIATVATVATETCLATVNEMYNQKHPMEWTKWTVNGWHVGYYEKYTNYTFATVKGAGHEAPKYQPVSSYNMFVRFLTKQDLAETNSSDQDKMLYE